MDGRKPIAHIVVTVAAATSLWAVSACSVHSGSSGAARTDRPVPADGVCDLIAVPLDTMMKGGATFLEVVEDADGRGADRGVSAAVAFAVLFRGQKRAGQFRPVISFLYRRGLEETSEGAGKPPRLTPAIRANARKLDRFLADGGCG